MQRLEEKKSNGDEIMPSPLQEDGKKSDPVLHGSSFLAEISSHERPQPKPFDTKKQGKRNEALAKQTWSSLFLHMGIHP